MSKDILDKLHSGIQHQQDGQLHAAEELYRQILDESPDHPDALHLLGVLAYQIADYDVAEELINHAIRTDEAVADYHNNLGEVLRATGREAEAKKQYEIALELEADHANAKLNMEKLQPAPVIEKVSAGVSMSPSDQIPEVRHALPSYLLSLDDENSKPNARLIDISLLAAYKANSINLDGIKRRFDKDSAIFLDVWPGEHFRLLAALVEILQPQQLIEIGTTNGASTLTMKHFLPESGKITCFCDSPWENYPGTGMIENDFNDQLEHRQVDLSNPLEAEQHHQTIEQADMIFINTLKNNALEKGLFKLLDVLNFSKPVVIVIDDIRIMPMLKIWRNISQPKLDMTSFGHWTGTGILMWEQAE